MSPPPLHLLALIDKVETSDAKKGQSICYGARETCFSGAPGMPETIIGPDPLNDEILAL